ncbi:isochorismatase family protein [Falsiroseomonas sp. HW251]|uniref:isochorismatase family protein n=1 Tax=Falsiroseomonas sp. HW251 TaxID=3390998 RepID=UPI003D31B303
MTTDTDATLAAIRAIYDSQHIRTKQLGFGRKAAVLVVDFQHLYTRGRASTGLDAVEATATLLKAARAAGMRAIYTVVAYAPGDEERVLWTMKLPGLLDNRTGSEAVQVDPLIAPQPGDSVIEKKAASAFLHTGLAEALKAEGVDTLLVCGTSTSGCVRASVVEGMGQDFRMIVVKECVSDRSALLHEVALFDMGSKYADLVTLDEALAAIAAHRQAA